MVAAVVQRSWPVYPFGLMALNSCQGLTSVYSLKLHVRHTGAYTPPPKTFPTGAPCRARKRPPNNGSDPCRFRDRSFAGLRPVGHSVSGLLPGGRAAVMSCSNKWTRQEVHQGYGERVNGRTCFDTLFWGPWRGLLFVCLCVCVHMWCVLKCGVQVA